MKNDALTQDFLLTTFISALETFDTNDIKHSDNYVFRAGHLGLKYYDNSTLEVVVYNDGGRSTTFGYIEKKYKTKKYYKLLRKLYDTHRENVDKKKDNQNIAVLGRLLSEHIIPSDYFTMRPELAFDIQHLYPTGNNYHRLHKVNFVADKVYALFLLEQDRFKDWREEQRNKE